MNKTKIEWCDYTWNPVTGCKCGCHFCYAKQIHNRFNKTPFTDIVFHPERLNDKMPDTPSKIFVGSMSGCEYWSDDMWREILAVCWNNPKHTFMFLTKHPDTYRRMKSWPVNTMQGLTLTMQQSQIEQANLLESIAWCPDSFVSIEPLLGSLQINIPEPIKLVIVGAMTGHRPIVPKPEWIGSIRRFANGHEIFWKENIKAGALHYSLQQTHGGQSVTQPAPNCEDATSPC